MNRRSLLRALLATVAVIKTGRLPAAPVEGPVWAPQTAFEPIKEWRRDDLRCVFFYKNDKLVGQLGPASIITDKAVAEGWADAPTSFSAGDVMGIELRYAPD